jgi:hypothetical protein
MEDGIEMHQSTLFDTKQQTLYKQELNKYIYIYNKKFGSGEYKIFDEEDKAIQFSKENNCKVEILIKEVKGFYTPIKVYFKDGIKYVEDECELNEIHFTDNINEIKKFYDNGFKSSFSYFDLMDHLNDEGVFENNE